MNESGRYARHANETLNPSLARRLHINPRPTAVAGTYISLLPNLNDDDQTHMVYVTA